MKENGNIYNGIKYLILSVICSMAGLFMPELLLVTGTFALAFNIAAFVLLPYAAAFIPALFIFFLALLLGQNYYMAALFAGVIFPASLGIAVCIRKKANMVYTVVTGIILSSIWMFADLGAYIYIRGGELSANGLKIAFDPLVSQFNSLYLSVIEMYDKMSPELAVQMKNAFATIKETFGNYLISSFPSLIITLIAIMTFAAVLISKRFLYKSGVDVSELKLFRDFRLPKSAAILFILCLFGEVIFSGFVETAFYNFFSVLATLFLFSGLSFLSFWMNRAGLAKPAVRVIFLFILLLCFLPVSFSMVISGTGVLDSLSDFRIRLSRRKGE